MRTTIKRALLTFLWKIAYLMVNKVDELMSKSPDEEKV